MRVNHTGRLDRSRQYLPSSCAGWLTLALGLQPSMICLRLSSQPHTPPRFFNRIGQSLAKRQSGPARLLRRQLSVTYLRIRTRLTGRSTGRAYHLLDGIGGHSAPVISGVKRTGKLYVIMRHTDRQRSGRTTGLTTVLTQSLRRATR